MGGTILKPASLKEMTTEAQLMTGTGSGYGLGLALATDTKGHRRWSHGGGTAGFIGANVMLPDDHIAVAVLTNGESPVAPLIERQIEDLLLSPTLDPGGTMALERARSCFLACRRESWTSRSSRRMRFSSSPNRPSPISLLRSGRSANHQVLPKATTRTGEE